MTTVKRLSTFVQLALFLSGALIIALPITPAASAEDKADTLTLPPETNTPSYEYQLENRADPFAPFITDKAATASVDMNEIVDETGPLTGMQLFEPGQLTLVALLKKNSEDLAMVQDFTGKGYVLAAGTKVGRRGIVKNISQNSVVIEETAVTRAGKNIVNEVVMLLKKEGEE